MNNNRVDLDKEIQEIVNILNLEMTTRINFRRASEIVCAAILFNLSLLPFVPKTSALQWIGWISSILFIRLIFGSPFEKVLTPESAKELLKFLNEDSLSKKPTKFPENE